MIILSIPCIPKKWSKNAGPPGIGGGGPSNPLKWWYGTPRQESKNNDIIDIYIAFNINNPNVFYYVILDELFIRKVPYIFYDNIKKIIIWTVLSLYGVE